MIVVLIDFLLSDVCITLINIFELSSNAWLLILTILFTVGGNAVFNGYIKYSASFSEGWGYKIIRPCSSGTSS